MSLKSKFLFLFVVSFIYGCSNNHVVKYHNAYEYIIYDDSVKTFFKDVIGDKYTVCISDTIVHMPITNFLQYFVSSDTNSKEMKKYLDSLMKIEAETCFIPYTMKNLRSFSDDKNSNLILFFSKPFSSELMAEVFYDENHTRSYTDVTRTNQSIMFLFFFDNENKIIKVFKTNLQYE